MLFVFGNFELDPTTFRLSRSGSPVSVQPKVFKLLLHLLTHRDRVVTNDELVATLWPRETIGPASITRAIRGARKAIDDDGDSQATIRNVRGHGYRFVQPVTEVEQAGQGHAADGGELPSTPLTPAPARVVPMPVPHATSDEHFVGYAAVIAALDRALLELSAGHGRCLLFAGEPGIGKTRTLHELALRARRSGARVWSARCLEGEGAPAFWPIIQLVREAAEDLGSSALRVAMGAGAADIAQAIPDLKQWMQELVSAPAIDSSSARFRFFDSMTTFLERVAATQPLVLLFDDVQSADEPTARLLAFLVRQLERSPVLVVAASRSAGQRPWTAALLSEFSKPLGSVSIELSGFSETEVARYLEQRTGFPPPPGVASQLHDQTAGNPLFLQQLTERSLCTAQPAQAWEPLLAASQGRALGVAIERHLGVLSESCRALLRIASVLGRDFSLGLLVEISAEHSGATHKEALLAQLAEAGDNRIVSQVPESPGHYRFTHALIRDALYEQVPFEERVRLHQRAGLALEARGAASSSSLLSHMAEHFVRAAPYQESDRALRYTLRAAEDATERLAYEEAALHVDRALRVIDVGTPDRHQRLDLLLAKGEALTRATLPTAARGVLLEAASLARALESHEGVLRAAMLLVRPHETGAVDATQVAWLREALTLLGPHDQRRPRLQALLAKSLSYSRGQNESGPLALAALADTRSLPEGEQRAEALFACHEALAGPQHLQTRLGISDELMRLSRKLNVSAMVLRAATTQIGNSLELGDMVAVELAVDTLEVLALGVREPVFRWYAKLFRAMCATLQGHFTVAEALANEAVEFGSLIGEEIVQHAHVVQVVAIMSLQGRLVEAEQLIRNVSARFPALGGWRAMLAVFHTYFGHQAQPRKVLEELLANDMEAMREPYFLGALAPTSELCALVGAPEHAKQLYDAMLPYEAHCGNVALGLSSHGPMARPLGMMAMRMGDAALGAQHLQRAIVHAERMQSPPYIGLSCVSYARALLMLDTSRGRSEAIEVLSRAQGIGEAIQSPGVVALCALLRSKYGIAEPQPQSA